jgi:hypothetical protein
VRTPPSVPFPASTPPAVTDGAVSFDDCEPQYWSRLWVTVVVISSRGRLPPVAWSWELV